MKRSALDQRLAQGVLIGDGAMGTILYQHGVFLNRCFDELNLADPKLVRKVHTGYVEAGVDFIETNTFGANRLKLSRFGLAGEVESINRAGVRIDREAAGDSILVAGAMGPLGGELAGHDPVSLNEATEMFAEQAGALVQAGVDLLILETFSNTQEQGRVTGIEIARALIAATHDRVAGFAVSAPFGNVETALAVLGKADVNVG